MLLEEEPAWFSSSASGPVTVGALGRRLEVREGDVELACELLDAVGERRDRRVVERCLAARQEEAHHHVQRDVDDVVTRTASVGESADVATGVAGVDGAVL